MGGYGGRGALRWLLWTGMADQRKDNRDPDRDSDKSPFRFPRGSGIFLLVILLGFLVAQVLMPQGDPSTDLTYNQFLSTMADTSLRVRSLTINQSPDGVELYGKRDLTPKEKSAQVDHTFQHKSDSREFRSEERRVGKEC